MALCIHRFVIHRFNQPQIKNTHIKKFPESSKKQDLNLPCIKHYAESMQMKFCVSVPCYSLYANIGHIQILCHFIYRTWASVDFGVHGDPGHHRYQGMTEFWGNQNLTRIFRLDRGQYPKALHRSKFNSVCLHMNPLQYRQLTLIGGIWIIPDILELTIYLVTTTHECLISTVYPGSLQLGTWEDAKVAETPKFWLKPYIHLKSMLWAFCSLLPI